MHRTLAMGWLSGQERQYINLENKQPKPVGYNVPKLDDSYCNCGKQQSIEKLNPGKFCGAVQGKLQSHLHYLQC